MEKLNNTPLQRLEEEAAQNKGFRLPRKQKTAESDSRLRMLLIIGMLEREHPDAKIALDYTNPLELLVATILSAQCTDERVNAVTRTLFKKYKTVKDYADADLKKLEQDIKPTGFYHNKARNIKRCCGMLIEKFGEQVPKTMEELLQLPGVARKTANVVLSNAYGTVEGIAVDTHVRRLAQRLGFTQNMKPEKIEQDLMQIVPKNQWMRITDLLIFHGRRVCEAKKPRCDRCAINRLCPSAFTVTKSLKAK